MVKIGKKLIFITNQINLKIPLYLSNLINLDLIGKFGLVHYKIKFLICG